MAATLSGEFVTVTINGTDYSQYFSEVEFKYSKDMRDQTTFNTGGAPVAKKNTEGAIVSGITMKAPFNKTLCNAMKPFIGKRTGTTVTIKGGSNNLPTTGDEQASGTFAIPEFSWPYKTGQDSDITFNWEIPDGATSPTPSISTVS